MSDLIEREPIIDRLNYVIEHGVANKSGKHAISAEAVKEYIEALPPVEQRTGRWIPVSERLPEVGSIVLCSCKHPEFMVGKINVCKYYAPDKYSDKPYFDFNMNGFPTVEAWMPLPEPYKENADV